MHKLFLLSFTVYLLFINLTGFFLMGSDKKRAATKKWRIPERVLFLSALLGGSLGCNIGMQCFRHKTKHWYFSVFMPLILIFQCAFFLYFCYNLTI